MPSDLWPESLIQAIARRDFVVFIGSGLSAASTNDAGGHPPTWFDLISTLGEMLTTQAARQRVKRRSKVDLLDAAEILVSEMRELDRLADLRSRIAELTDGPEGDRYQPNEWHDEVMRLYPSIVLTTNYDRIIERNNGFAVIRPDDQHLGRDIRLGRPIIVKMHGTSDVEEGLILTHTDYARLRRECGHMLDLVRSLLLTRTCLFLGYSLGDPDIRLLLEAVARPYSGEVAHYLLGPRVSAENRHLRSLFAQSYGVAHLGYAGDHAQGLQRLAEL